MEQHTLFGLPDYVAQPKTKHASCGCFTDASADDNHYKNILAYLRKGKTLTVSECIKKFFTAELRTYCCMIAKREGLVIDKEWQYSDDRKKKWKKYWIKVN